MAIKRMLDNGCRAMDRTLTPEILDVLPVNDSRAIQSRRDLRRINRLMGNIRWWQRTVARAVRPDERVLEIGAGDAAFSPLPNRMVDALDRMPRPAHWPRRARWHRVSAQSFTAWSDYDAVIGNLVFHHFGGRELRDLGACMAERCRVIAACEPRRARRFQVAFAALAEWVLTSDVTRHDGMASIAAGFRDDELPRALGLDKNLWSIRIDQTLRGAYRMLAVRRN